MKYWILTCLLLLSNFALAEKSVLVGGEKMVRSKDIVDNLSHSRAHTTFMALVKESGLEEILRGEGPFTVFAPTNEAFAKLPNEMLEGLRKPEKRTELLRFLTYQIVPDKLDKKALLEGAKESGGRFALTTIAGSRLVVMPKGTELEVEDESGKLAKVLIKDVYQRNGVVHVTDAVLQMK